MAILYRFICSKHGEFDAWGDTGVRCPMAKCRCKPRQMVTAPAIRTTTRTADADKTLQTLASDFKMTDIKSTREGESQAGVYTHQQNRDPQPRDSVMWGNAGRFNMENVLKNGAAASVRGEQVGLKPTDVGVKRGPMAASYIADHENLKIDK